MEKQEAYFRSLIEDALDIITVTDRLGIIQYASPSNLRVLGYTPEELLGKNAFALVHPEDRLHALKQWGKGILQPGIPHWVQFRYRHKDGSYRTLEAIGKYVNDSSGPPRAVLNSRDITDRDRLEGIVRQSEKMAAVGQLAAGVAHEMNNPLSVVLGFAQAMLHRLPPTDPLYAAAQSIERESLRCKNLVQNLLTFSRRRKPGMTVEPFLPLLESALSLVETQARIKNVNVQRDLNVEDIHIQGDRDQIQEVLINLCTNAMDAMPDGGELTIRAEKQRNDVEIRVTDTGTGIPKEIQGRVFEPFYTTKEVGKGTGLGLSLAYEIVQKHQGHIDFETVPGKGTTFIVRLPLAQSAKRAA
jgi:PAS domain S-box-containing protein